jgi:hypothetical protein
VLHPVGKYRLACYLLRRQGENLSLRATPLLPGLCEERVVVGLFEGLTEEPPLELVLVDNLGGLAALKEVDGPDHAVVAQEALGD